MAIAKEADEEAVDENFLAHDDAGDLVDEWFHPVSVFLDLPGEFGSVDAHGMTADGLMGF
jgi:hypothetical protein